ALPLVVGAAGSLEVFVEIPNPGSGEVAAVAAGNEVDLVVQIKDGIVDGRGSKQDKFLPLTADLAAAAIGGQDALQVLVALGVAVAKVVAFVHEQDIRVQYVAAIEFIASQALLGDDVSSNAGAEQFVAPHCLQGGGADD